MSSRSPRKILFILQNLEGGGAERVFINIANGFVKKGHDVTLLLGMREGVYFELLHPLIKLEVCNCNTLVAFMKMLPKFLKKEHFSHIFTASPVITSAVVMSRKLKKFSSKVIATIHFNLPIQLSILPKANRSWLYFLHKYMIAKADVIVSVSDGVGKGFRRIVSGKLPHLETIYNPVFDDSIYTAGEEELTETELEQRPLLINVGRLAEQKNQIDLLRAIKLLVKDMPSVLLLMLGEGPCEKQLKQYVEEQGIERNVRFMGFQKNPFKFINNADLLVLSSIYEGLPTVLIEALALGTNVVSTNCPSGPFEILEGNKYGWLARVNDSKDLCDKIKDALENPKPIEMLKERALFFHSDRIIQKYLDLLT